MARATKRADRNGRQTLTVGQVAELFNGVSQPCRLGIILMLEQADRNVGEIGKATKLSPAAVGYHLTLLRAGGMINSRREGSRVYYGLTATGRAVAACARQLGA